MPESENQREHEDRTVIQGHSRVRKGRNQEIPVGATVTGSSWRSCSSVGMDIGMMSARPRLVPTHKHGVGRVSDLRPNDSANCRVVTASLVSLSMLETLELRDRLNEFSRLSENEWRRGERKRGLVRREISRNMEGRGQTEE